MNENTIWEDTRYDDFLKIVSVFSYRIDTDKPTLRVLYNTIILFCHLDYALHHNTDKAKGKPSFST